MSANMLHLQLLMVFTTGDLHHAWTYMNFPYQLVIMTTTLSLYIQLTILTFCMGMLMLTGRQTLVAENQPLGLLSCMLVE